MIYYLTLVFTLVFFLPIDFLNFHSRVYWWAQDNPLYLPLIFTEVKLEGNFLYYTSLVFLYFLFVVLVMFGLVGLPIFMQIVATLYPSRGMLLFGEGFARKSLDLVNWLRAPFTFRQEKMRWVWATLDVITITRLLAVILSAILSWLIGNNFKMPPNAIALTIGYWLVRRLGRFETGIVWNINENMRRSLERKG
jgi:hypothetical protein